MYLVIAEKPSVARSIAEVLGCSKSEKGYLEGTGCIVSWCLGHLAEYLSPDQYDDRYQKWKFEDLPICPDPWRLAVPKDKKEQFYVLKNLLNRPDIAYVVNACDAGREGELIFKHVYDLSGSKKPVKRLWISSMEDEAIRQGFAEAKDAQAYENLAKAALCRAQADWLVGMNATRAFTTRYFRKLIVGRVQTPTLAMIVERHDGIEHFRKEKYFNLELDLDGFMVEKQKIFSEEEANALLEKCQGAEAEILTVETKEKAVNPPKLYDLTSLQRDANRIFGMTAKQTLDTAQQLYEKKVLTYPRTDSRYLTEDMASTVRGVIHDIHEVYQVMGPFDTPPVPDLSRVINNKKVADHHAIIPTRELRSIDRTELSVLEKNILLLTSVRLLEATAESGADLEQTVTAGCAGEEFSKKGKYVRKPGWRIYEQCLKNDEHLAMEDAESLAAYAMPAFVKGQKFYGVDAKKSEHYTTPPKEFTEDTLLSAMETAGKKEFAEDTEKKGLGTPATRAAIIEKLIYSRFAERKGKIILPTEDGKQLIEAMPEYLRSPAMTAEWENKLLLMERGEVTDTAFMEGIYGLLGQIIETCAAIVPPERSGANGYSDREVIGECPICGKPIFEGKLSFYCSDRGCMFALWKENRFLQSMDKTMSKDLAKGLLADRRVRVKDLYSAKKNAYFNADLLMDIDEQGRARLSLDFSRLNKHK